MKTHDTTVVDCHIAFIAKQRMHRNIRLAESCHAPALWRHDRDVNNQNIAMLLIFLGWFAMFTVENLAPKYKVNMTKSMSI